MTLDSVLATPTDALKLSGAVADRYSILREVGRGGMARVYLARDLRHERDVALKVLREEIAAAIGTERFLNEIRTAARLNHPHIVPLHDSGGHDGLLYYVMPFITGPTLRRQLEAKGRLPLGEAVQITRQIALALDYAHRLGIVHRDVKPENVLLHEGEVLVADFGIAKALHSVGGTKLTLAGLALGTPHYMSPEQAAGGDDVDARSDQYSLGCILYEMLSGQPPFTGPSAQAVMARRFVEDPKPITALVPGIPAAVSRILARALARDPADRFPSAAEFATALECGCITSPAGAEPAEDRSIAVLPFANMSTDPENEFFSDGITEEIINALTKLESLDVASRTSAFAFRDGRDDIREIGRKLGVTTVLEGSVRRSGNKLRVTAQLIDVENGYHLWSERYDREMADVFAIQDEIAENIVKALRLVLTKREQAVIRSARAKNVRAYEYYLRGRQLFHQWRRQGWLAAEDMFRRAIALDPAYPLGYTGLADSSAFRYLYFNGGEEALQQADVASARALELDPNLAEARSSRGLALLCEKRFAEAEGEFKAAMELDPTLFEAPYFYGRMLWTVGRMEEAVAFFELASSLREDDYQASALAGSIYRSLGREDRMAAMARRTIAAAERSIAADPHDARPHSLGALAHLHIGEIARAREWANRALELDPAEAAVLYNVACMRAVSGEPEGALDLLERFVDYGSTSPEWLREDPDLAGLHGHPRFERLIERLQQMRST